MNDVFNAQLHSRHDIGSSHSHSILGINEQDDAI